MSIRKLLLIAILAGCGPKHHSKPAQSDTRREELASLYTKYLDDAQKARDPETGWLDRMGCDAMIWNGEYASANGVTGVNILAAEYSETPGRFARRALPPDCWSEVNGDQGSKTTWSRDMAVAGLIPFLWLHSERNTLERHIQYGEENNWQMGLPSSEERSFYTPQLIGLLYKARHALTGETSAQENWPSVYPSGLTDYEAHLQVKSIWLQGRIANALHDPNAIPHPGAGLLDISNSMYERLEEHASQNPPDPFFTAALAEYSGDYSRTLDLLLDPAMPVGTFVRCDQLEQCKLAHWLFVASLTLEALKSAGN